jgi:hypothetical protein
MIDVENPIVPNFTVTRNDAHVQTTNQQPATILFQDVIGTGFCQGDAAHWLFFQIGNRKSESPLSFPLLQFPFPRAIM